MRRKLRRAAITGSLVTDLGVKPVPPGRLVGPLPYAVHVDSAARHSADCRLPSAVLSPPGARELPSALVGGVEGAERHTLRLRFRCSPRDLARGLSAQPQCRRSTWRLRCACAAGTRVLSGQLSGEIITSRSERPYAAPCLQAQSLTHLTCASALFCRVRRTHPSTPGGHRPRLGGRYPPRTNGHNG